VCSNKSSILLSNNKMQNKTESTTVSSSSSIATASVTRPVVYTSIKPLQRSGLTRMHTPQKYGSLAKVGHLPVVHRRRIVRRTRLTTSLTDCKLDGRHPTGGGTRSVIAVLPRGQTATRLLDTVCPRFWAVWVALVRRASARAVVLREAQAAPGVPELSVLARARSARTKAGACQTSFWLDAPVPIH